MVYSISCFENQYNVMFITFFQSYLRNCAPFWYVLWIFKSSMFEIVIYIEWNNCLPFETPAKTLTSCKQTGADQYCSIQCEANTHPSGVLNTNKYYTCGPSTQFQWSHSLQNVTLPFCSGKRQFKSLYKWSFAGFFYSWKRGNNCICLRVRDAQ